ncbi:MAG: ABC transporter permease [Gemmatimonadales bacterium]|nr:MAG: ABC transporter permease [Gemmatimonadales bacterium]
MSASPMRTVPILIAREYLQRVRTKGFVLGTIGAPIFLLAIVLIPQFLAGDGILAQREIALVDRTGVLAERLAPRLEDGGFEVELVADAEAEDRAIERAREGEISGVLVVDERTLQDGSATFRGLDSPSTLRQMALRQAVNQTALAVRLTDDADASLLALLQGGGLEMDRLGDEEDVDETGGLAGYAVGFIGAFFLYFVLLIYGNMVLRSVLEEKTGRIAEVVLSSVPAWELMLGKIVGVGAVGLTQILVWVLSAVLILSLGVPAAIPFLGEMEFLADLPAFLPSAWVLAFFIVCFIMGYFIYSSLFAAVGAMCSTEEEAQQAQLPVMMLIIVPFIMLLPVLEAPDTTFAQLSSLFPFFTPIIMFGRVAVGTVPAWELGVSVVGMAAAILAVAWVAGRIYRVGILMQGKRPTLPELWRWVRRA